MARLLITTQITLKNISTKDSLNTILRLAEHYTGMFTRPNEDPYDISCEFIDPFTFTYEITWLGDSNSANELEDTALRLPDVKACSYETQPFDQDNPDEQDEQIDALDIIFNLKL